MKRKPCAGPHHWLIGQPEGPVLRGVCLRCGQEREWPADGGLPPNWKDNKDAHGALFDKRKLEVW